MPEIGKILPDSIIKTTECGSSDFPEQDSDTLFKQRIKLMLYESFNPEIS
jgi:hypothetical protein